jgi:hypothetical protein
MMEAARTSETLVNYYQIARRYNQKTAISIIANVRHVSLYECALREMRNKLKLSSDGGDFGRKKCKRGYGGAYGGVWQSLRLAGVWRQAIGFMFVRLAGMWLQSS